MSEVITTAYSEIGDDKKFCEKKKYPIKRKTHVLLWLSCHDLDKRSMYHDMP